MKRRPSGVRRALCVVAVAALFAACSESNDNPRAGSSITTEAADTTDAAETTDAPETTDAVEPTATDAPDTTPPESAAPETTTVDTTPVTEPASEGEGWTVLVYSIADTDLEPYLLEDVVEMGQVGSSDGLDIVALVDRAADYSSDGLLGLDDWQGGKLLHIGEGTAEVLADYGDINTGDPQVLADFIAQGITNFPAARYSLVISNHGASWPGVGGDESSDHDLLTIAEMKDGITAGLSAAGLDKLDMLGFDACLMATYEVASALAPVADRLLASQELEPGHGWDYRALQLLADAPDTDVDTFGAVMIDAFEGQAKELGTESDITLSLIDLNQMAALDTALAGFTDALVESVSDIAPVIGQTRAGVLGFGKSPDPNQDTHMADLGLLVAQIGIEALFVSDQADELMRALNDVVVDKVNGVLTAGATGLSIYFPPYPALYNADYEGVESSAKWVEFLTSFYGAGEAIPEEEQPEFLEATDGGAEVFFDEDGLNIFGTFDIAALGNLAEATIDYGLVDEDGSVTFIGQEPAAIAEDGSGTALGVYDLTALTITDGIDTAYAYLSLTFDEDAGIATVDVPLAYYPPDSDSGEYQDVLLTLTLDIDGNVINETYYSYNADLGTYGELTADPLGIIVPQVLYVSAGGEAEWIPTSDVGLFADLPSLQYDLEPLPSGTQLWVELTVTDFGGNFDSIYAIVDVP